MDRMKDEPVFLALASKASDYLGGRGEVKAQAKIALRRVEHFYYKTDTVYGAMRRMTIAQQEAQQQAAPVQQVKLCPYFPSIYISSIPETLFLWTPKLTSVEGI